MNSLDSRRSLLAGLLRDRPVIASLFAPDDIEVFAGGDAPVCIIANADLHHLEPVVDRLRGLGRFVLVNLDSTTGLASDSGGVDYLASIGVEGVVTTRGTLVSRVTQRGMVSVQKLFVTDRLNLPRSARALASAKPTFVQIMPAPVLPFIRKEPVLAVSPVIAGGFVSTPDDVRAALSCGASAVSTSARPLWGLKKAKS